MEPTKEELEALDWVLEEFCKDDYRFPEEVFWPLKSLYEKLAKREAPRFGEPQRPI